MRFILLNILLLFSISVFCQWKSFEIYAGDTINRIDKNGLKQGLWIYFNDKYKNRIVEKGYYKDGKKEGVWEIYYPNGQLKAQITFKNNRQYGPVKIYYPNGVLNEEGIWKGNRWVGLYKYYYENGKPKYIWYYNEDGKRTGIQKYFYENGQIYIVGNWEDGKEQGEIKEYYPNGQLKKISHWKDGKLDGEVLEYYPNGQLKLKRYFVNGVEDKSKQVFFAQVEEPDTLPSKSDTAEEPPSRVYRQFSGTGHFKFYNSKGQIVSEGYFKNGILYTGKKYFYDKDGNLKRIIVFKQGQIVNIIVKNDKQ